MSPATNVEPAATMVPGKSARLIVGVGLWFPLRQPQALMVNVSRVI
ncbi:MAG: hypothetical protein U0X87_08960 [Anaerolineales bacterium]